MSPIVVYIAGYGRSGSTVLEMALSGQAGFFGAGELTHLFRDLAAGASCACRANLRSCPVWSAVGRPRQAELERTRDLIRRTERSAVLPQASHRSRVASTAYVRTWRGVFDVLARRAGARVVVDSSKTAGAANRPSLLAEHCGLDVRVVHLVRDPRAVMWSILRGSNRRLASGADARVRFGLARALVGWTRWNRIAERQIQAGAFLATRVRYEDFVAQPTGELQRIGSQLGLDLEDAARALREQRPLPSGHGIAGNRARAAGVQRLRLDEEWRRMLPWHGTLLARMAGPLAARYGYDLGT